MLGRAFGISLALQSWVDGILDGRSDVTIGDSVRTPLSSVEGGFQSWQIRELLDVLVLGVQLAVDGGVGLLLEVVLLRLLAGPPLDKLKGCGLVLAVSGDSAVVAAQGRRVGLAINLRQRGKTELVRAEFLKVVAVLVRPVT